MIPASYMFKDIYHHAWEEPAPAEIPTVHRKDGLHHPMFPQLLTRLQALIRHHHATHDRPAFQ